MCLRDLATKNGISTSSKYTIPSIRTNAAPSASLFARAVAAKDNSNTATIHLLSRIGNRFTIVTFY